MENREIYLFKKKEERKERERKVSPLPPPLLSHTIVNTKTLLSFHLDKWIMRISQESIQLTNSTRASKQKDEHFLQCQYLSSKSQQSYNVVNNPALYRKEYSQITGLLVLRQNIVKGDCMIVKRFLASGIDSVQRSR